MIEHEIKRPQPSSQPHPQRLVASYVLGALFILVLIVAWLRGAGRLLIPLLLIAAAVALVRRIVRKIKEPIP